MSGLRRLLLAVLVGVGLFVPELPGAEAGKPARPTRATKKTPKAKPAKQKVVAVAKKPRFDKGDPVPANRRPAKAKVGTGDHVRAPSKGKRRIDPSTLPKIEQTALAIEELLRGPLRYGTTSLYVTEAETGKPLFSVYPDDPLNPASNVKLISTAAALDTLGPDYRYVTRLLGTAPDAIGLIDQDLYLLGSYDPTLDKKALQGLADSLIADGVTTISGDVLVGGTPTRDGIFRSWGELRVTATSAGMPPAVSISSTTTDFILIENKAETSSKKRVKAKQGIKIWPSIVTDEAGHQRMKITVTGQIGRGKTVIKDTFIKERAQWAAHLLRQLLRDAGVTVTGDVRVVELGDYMDQSIRNGFIPVPLAEHESQRLADIVRRVNKRSTNWLADRLIFTAAGRYYKEKPSREAANNLMYEWLDRHTGLQRDDLVVDGGSGLSYKTELSAKQVVKVLRAGLGIADKAMDAPDDPVYAAYRDSLAIGGKDGTIRHRYKKLRGTVRGKTGTLHRVVALSGTLKASNGRRAVFSIITNGHDPKWKGRIRGAHEQLVNLICDYLHALPALDDTEPTEGEPVIESIEPEPFVPGSRAAQVIQAAENAATASEAIEFEDEEDGEQDDAEAEADATDAEAGIE